MIATSCRLYLHVCCSACFSKCQIYIDSLFDSDMKSTLFCWHIYVIDAHVENSNGFSNLRLRNVTHHLIKNLISSNFVHPFNITRRHLCLFFGHWFPNEKKEPCRAIWSLFKNIECLRSNDNKKSSCGKKITCKLFEFGVAGEWIEWRVVKFVLGWKFTDLSYLIVLSIAFISTTQCTLEYLEFCIYFVVFFSFLLLLLIILSAEHSLLLLS